ncbi:hypothetical protein TorRG33x02_064310, partial [Trema orientale]
MLNSSGWSSMARRHVGLDQWQASSSPKMTAGVNFVRGPKMMSSAFWASNDSRVVRKFSSLKI